MPQRELGQNFLPFNNYSVAFSSTSASQNTSVTQPVLGQKCRDLLIQNNTNQVAYVAWGATAQTATSANFPVLAGAIIAIDMGVSTVTNIAVALAASGTGTVYFSIGVGT